MTDEFFDDELELMEEGTGPEQGAVAGEELPEVDSAPASTRRDAPPFWMVLAIASIALVLGVVIGYLLGTSATISELEASQKAAQEQVMASGDGVSLPDGHPDLSISEDGTATVAGSSEE